jgi:cytidylate kinase
LRAEYDEMIDAQVDHVTKELADSKKSTIFDSRMAWQIVHTAFRVHLIVEPSVAAKRLYRERSSGVEGYGSVAEARRAAEERYQSERRRFLAKYDVDVSLLENYHLVVDTSDASIDEVATEIDSAWHAEAPIRVSLLISPKRVLPGRDPRGQIDIPPTDIHASSYSEPTAISRPIVAYARPFIYVLYGQPVISDSIRRGRRLIAADLLAEGSQVVEQGLSAVEYLHTMIHRSWIDEWEKAHDFQFETYPEPMKA